MSQKGYIKLHRKILENPVVCKDSDYIAVWTYLLLNATHKEYPVIFAGEKILLQPGQLITGRKAIAEKFNISESKVQRILKSFEIERQIEQQNSNKNRLITIVSWSDYQSDEQQDEQPVNNKRTTTEQQVNTNKNVKNVKNKRNKEINNIPKIDFAEFVSLTQEEYEKLVSAHGEERAKRMIEILNNYKGSSGKKYKSDYLAILNWVVKRVEEEEARRGRVYKPQREFEAIRSGIDPATSKFAAADKNKPFDPRELEELGLT